MIELHHISKSYTHKNNTIIALADITLEVKKAEIYGVIGKSGAGKSTLIRCVNLLERPTQGKVIVNQQSLMDLKPKDLRRARQQMGMVFQHFNLLNSRTVYHNIALPLQLIKTDKKTIEKKVRFLLTLINLTHREHAFPHQLSGGEKQRVAIARALALDPHVLLCDEMTSALDPETTVSILNLIREINQKLGISILLITHEMDVIKKLAHRVAVLEQGKIIEEGNIISIFKNPTHALTKRLTQASLSFHLPPDIQNNLQIKPIENGFTLLRIIFMGDTAKTPIIDYLSKKYLTHINILQANLELINLEIVGVMIVALKASSIEIKALLQDLNEKQLSVEIIGYVESKYWFYG